MSDTERANDWINRITVLPEKTDKCDGEYFNKNQYRIEYWSEGIECGWINLDAIYFYASKNVLRRALSEFYQRLST